MRQVLPIAGAIVGAYFGNPQLGFAIGSLIGNAVDPQEIQGSKVGDNPMQTASEGGARAIVFGTGCVRATCLLERGNRQVVEVEDQAGKGGPVTVNERVYWTFAVGLGEAIPGGAIIRIWEGEKLVYDATPSSPIPDETAEFARKFRFYDGSEDQLPDPALEAIHGIGNAHYYRGTAYVVFPNYDLTDYREQVPVYRWEIASASEGTAGVRWLMSAGFTDGGALKSSPDGEDWSQPSFDPGISTTDLLLYRHGEKVLGLSGGNGNVFSDSLGDDWGSFSGNMAGQDLFSAAVYVFGNWLIAGSGGGFNVRALRDGVLVDQGWSARCLAEVQGSLFSVSSGVSNSISLRDQNGNAIWSANFRDGGNGVTLASSENDVAIIWLDWDGVTHISSTTPYSEVCVEHTNPIPNVPFSSSKAIFSKGLNLWLVIIGTSIAYGPTLGELQLSDYTLPQGANWLSEDGEKFVIVGLNRMCLSTTDGQNFQPHAIANTLPDTSLLSVVALEFGADVVGEPVPLSSIIASLHDRAGHTPADYDVSELTEMVGGVVFEATVTFAEAINSIIGSYFKDPSEYDKRIHYLSRGKPVVRTLTEDDLVDEPESSRRENAIEYPRKLHYFFQSPITHYAATKATSARSSPDVNVIGEASVSSPITYNDPDEPAQVSAKLHKVYWADAEGEIVWHVTDEHADLVPGDCVGLSLRGVVRRARITSIEDDPGVRKLTMRVDRQSAYTSNVTGIPLPPPTPPRPSIIAPSIGLTLDIPALTDDADDLHYLRAITGLSDVWAGAVDQRSLDGGASFTSINTAGQAAVVGVLQAEVTAASPHFTDTTNVVAVDLFVDRDIESISDQQLLSEGGAFALSYMDGDERRWELCQYRDADEDSGGNKLLSTLHRGLLNTEAAAHAPGDYFVLLGRGILKNNAQSSWLGQEMVHRAVSNGLSPEAALTETATYTGQSQTEFPVASIELTLDGDDLMVSIVPRHRFGTDDHPIRSINWTGYRVLATDGANSETYDTTDDDTTIDVTGWSGTINVTVSQINRITGAGPTVTESIPA